jgi:hypothetical protein
VSLRLKPKEWLMPRVDSHFFALIFGSFAYSGVRKSLCGTGGGTMPSSALGFFAM